MRPQLKKIFASAGCDRKQREKIEGGWALECELEIEVSISSDD
jgi:hypothetical protein